MITFIDFLLEGLSGKQTKKILRHPDGSQTIEHPDAPVVWHDKENATTAYHIKTPEAAHTFGQGTSWCTNTKHKSWAHEYLNAGNLFVIHKGKSRIQHFIAHHDSFHNETSLSEPNYTTPHFGLTHSKMFDRLNSIPHEKKNFKFVQPPPSIHEDTQDLKARIIKTAKLSFLKPNEILYKYGQELIDGNHKDAVTRRWVEEARKRKNTVKLDMPKPKRDSRKLGGVKIPKKSTPIAMGSGKKEEEKE